MRTDIEKESSTYRVTSQQCSDCSQALGTAVPSTGNPVPNRLGTEFPDGWGQGPAAESGIRGCVDFPCPYASFPYEERNTGRKRRAVKSPYSS